MNESSKCVRCRWMSGTRSHQKLYGCGLCHAPEDGLVCPSRRPGYLVRAQSRPSFPAHDTRDLSLRKHNTGTHEGDGGQKLAGAFARGRSHSRTHTSLDTHTHSLSFLLARQTWG